MKVNFYSRFFIAALIVFLFIFIILFLGASFTNKVYPLEKKAIFNKIISAADDYFLAETPYCKIYYTENDTDYIEIIKSAIDAYLPIVMNEFDLEQAEIGKLIVVVYPDIETLEQSLDIYYENAPMGVYYGGVINVLSPEIWISSNNEWEIKERFLSEGPIIHEMIHFATDYKANGNYPLWFTEGVALYYENKLIGYEWREDLRSQAAEISILQLEKDFRGINEGVAYRRAFDIISEFVKQKSEKELQEIIWKLGNEKCSFSDLYELMKV